MPKHKTGLIRKHSSGVRWSLVEADLLYTLIGLVHNMEQLKKALFQQQASFDLGC